MRPAKGKAAAAAVSSASAASSSPFAALRNGMILSNRWRLGKRLGEGACGQVWEVTDATGGQSAHAWVIKITPLPANAAPGGKKSKNRKDDALKRNADTLYFEQLVYKNYMMDVPHIPALPTLQAYGEDQGFRYLVMQRLGRDLCQEFEAKGKHFPPSTLADYGRQMLSTLRRLHEKQLIFIDVKPENFMLGLPGTREKKEVFMVDFGLVEKFTATNGTHKPEAGGGGGGGVGTPLFLSVAVHQGSAPARRDDVEALGMVLLFFARGGDLPWGTATSDADCLAKKKGAKLTDLVAGLPGGNMLKSFIELARNTVFEAIPDYNRFDAILQKLAKVKDIGAAGGGGGGAASSGSTATDGRKRKSGVAAAGSSGSSSAAAASSADENQDTNVDGAGGGKKTKNHDDGRDQSSKCSTSTSNSRSARGKRERPVVVDVPPPLPTSSSRGSSNTGGGWLAMASNAGKFVYQSIYGSSGNTTTATSSNSNLGRVEAERRDEEEKEAVDRLVDLMTGTSSSSSTTGKSVARKGGRGGGGGKGAAAAATTEVIEMGSSGDEAEGEIASVASSTASSSPSSFAFEVLEGPHKGQRFTILQQGGKAIYLGRDASHSKTGGGISLPMDKSIQPKHAKLEPSGRDSRTTSLKIVPSSTAAEVLVNNSKVGKSGRQIFPNDLIQIGSTTLVFRRG